MEDASTDIAAKNIMVQCQNQSEAIDLFVKSCAEEHERLGGHEGPDVGEVNFQLSRLAATKTSVLMLMAVQKMQSIKQ